MTIKQRALRDVALVAIAGMITGSVFVILANVFTPAVAGVIAALVTLGYVGKVAYDIRVSQLEFERDRIERALTKGE